MTVLTHAGLFIRRFCLAFDKLSFVRVIQLYKRFRLMYAEIKDRWSLDADVAGCILNETRDLSLDDFMDDQHSDYSTAKSWYLCVYVSLLSNKCFLKACFWFKRTK